jgi:Protein of unknown function (DUF3995)
MEPSSPIVSQQRSEARWPAYAAALWALLFAAYSFYGAAGGDLGVDQLARDIREEAEERDPGFVAELWVAGVLKLAAAALAIALAVRLGRAPRSRALLIVAWLLAAGLLVYGAANLVQFGLMKAGAISTPESVGSYAVDWYLFLWEPIWLLGGIAFAAAAWVYRRHTPS